MYLDFLYVAECVSIQLGDMLVMLDVIIDHRHLTPSNTGADITHTIVETNVLMLVVWERFAGLSGIEKNTLGSLLVGTYQCTATRSGDHFVAIETHDAETAESTGHLAFVFRAESLGRVFYYGNLITVGNLHDLVDIGWHAIHVDRHNSFGFFTRLLNAVLDGVFKLVGVHVPSGFFRAYQNRGGTQVDGRIAGGCESETLADDIVAFTHTKANHGQMYSGGAGGQCHHFLVLAGKALKVLLKGIDIRAKRCYPVSIKCFLNVFHLIPTHVS